jgi:hypothetical protein
MKQNLHFIFFACDGKMAGAILNDFCFVNWTSELDNERTDPFLHPTLNNCGFRNEQKKITALSRQAGVDDCFDTNILTYI